MIQQNLKTLFDNIVRLEFKQEIDIEAMISNEKEKVPFNKIPKMRGMIETWLDGV